ncbi:myb/SANT-like DNA-binding domain-containing protein 4 isoform X2 [Drosophila bipectinata]|nr:uncharacterized protein LOC108126043 isoform X1 [Drosophila bipectinata]
MHKRTRQRGRNFSPSEEVMLLELLKPFKDVIDNKKSDATTCQLKKNAWQQLACQFSLQTGMPRSWRTLKDKYKNMNSKLRIEGSFSSPRQSQEMQEPASSCVSVVYDDDDLDQNEFLEQGENFQGKLIQEKLIQQGESIQDVPVELETSEELSPEQMKEDKVSVSKRKRSFQYEQIKLILLQQQFQNDENIRAAEKHHLELKSISLRNELLELELEEKRRRMGMLSYV